jgi:hypothetical protein
MADVNAGARRACVVIIGQPYRAGWPMARHF